MDGESVSPTDHMEGPARVEKIPYEMIGGEPGVRRLVECFYEIMDTNPAAAKLRSMHAADLAPMRETLFEFLSGAFGGPPLYLRRPDAKCVMSAHARFKIGEIERDQWMMCMRGAMKSMELPAATYRFLDDGFFRMANAMVNVKQGRPAEEE